MNNKKSCVTVVTVVKNSEKLIEKTILNVLNQTFNDFDYIHDAYNRRNDIELCSYKGYQQDLFQQWKKEGWLDK